MTLCWRRSDKGSTRLTLGSSDVLSHPPIDLLVPVSSPAACCLLPAASATVYESRGCILCVISYNNDNVSPNPSYDDWSASLTLAAAG